MRVRVARVRAVLVVTTTFKAVQDDVGRPSKEKAEREHRQARIPPEGASADRLVAVGSPRPVHERESKPAAEALQVQASLHTL